MAGFGEVVRCAVKEMAVSKLQLVAADLHCAAIKCTTGLRVPLPAITSMCCCVRDNASAIIVWLCGTHQLQ
jgi:hypothetical protein